MDKEIFEVPLTDEEWHEQWNEEREDGNWRYYGRTHDGLMVYTRDIESVGYYCDYSFRHMGREVMRIVEGRDCEATDYIQYGHIIDGMRLKAERLAMIFHRRLRIRNHKLFRKLWKKLYWKYHRGYRCNGWHTMLQIPDIPENWLSFEDWCRSMPETDAEMAIKYDWLYEKMVQWHIV